MGKTATIIVFEDSKWNPMFRVLFEDALKQPDVYSVIEKKTRMIIGGEY